MKVMCICNKELSAKFGYITWNLTIGRIYEAQKEIDSYQILDETIGHEFSYPKDLFITIDEMRNQKLEEIGI